MRCCASELLIVGIDGTIVNVALPSIVRELGASSSQLQWIVDAYTLVFASFLLLAGSLGDRYGRKTALTAGLVVFGVGSLGFRAGRHGRRADPHPSSAGLRRSLHHALDALDPHERFPAYASGCVSASGPGVSGVGVAVGPITGGYLLGHFDRGIDLPL